MLNIKNQVFITIKIDGQPIEYANIKDLTLCEGNSAFAPTMKLELDDPTSSLSRARALSEGNTVEVLIAKSESDPSAVARRYRIFGPTRDNNSNNPNVVIIGLLDAPKFFTASSRESIEGTSDVVLKELANRVGFEYTGPTNGRQLNDKQIWLNVCSNRAKFMYEVTRNAYMDDKSCMESIITSTHRLVYRNLIDEINTSPDKIRFAFTHNAPDNSGDNGRNEFLVKEARDRSTAGVMSHWVNYGSTRSNNNIDGWQKDRKSVDVKAPSPYLAINQEVSDMVKRTRFDYAPIDCSNTHKYYQDAWYQNTKFLALFTETMSLLVNEVTDTQLLDPVIYRQADADMTAKVRNEDIYLVVGKTIVVRGGIHYAERLQVVRMSVTMKGTTQLKTSMHENETSPSIIPESVVDGSAFGKLASYVPQVSAMTSIVQQIGSMNFSLSGALSTVQGVLGSVLPSVSSLISSIAGGNGIDIRTALGAVAPDLSSMVQQIGAVSGTFGPAQNHTKSMADLTCQAPQGYAQAAYTQPNGIMDAVAAMMQIMAVTGQTAATVGGICNTLPSSVLGTEGAQVVNSINQLMYGLRNTSNMVSGTWNTVVSNTNRQPIPQYQGSGYGGYSYPGQVYNQPSYSQQTFDSGMMLRLMLLFAQGTPVTTDMIMAFLQQELMRQSYGQPNYATSNEFVLQSSPYYTQDNSMLTSMASSMGVLA